MYLYLTTTKHTFPGQTVLSYTGIRVFNKYRKKDSIIKNNIDTKDKERFLKQINWA